MPYNRRLKQNNEIIKEQQNPTPSKDYSLKEGEKIKINFGGMKVIIFICLTQTGWFIT